MTVSVLVFTRDLRITDNPALTAAARGGATDTNRYRVFNPTLQGRRFDPAGEYVRRYLPELAGLPATVIHDPDPATRRNRGYPEPIVDHREAVAAHRAARRG